MFFLIVSENKKGSYSIYAIFNFFKVGSYPSTNMSPLYDGISLNNESKSVDFPHPTLPIIAHNSPSLKLRVRFFNTGLSSSVTECVQYAQKSFNSILRFSVCILLLFSF